MGAIAFRNCDRNVAGSDWVKPEYDKPKVPTEELQKSSSAAASIKNTVFATTKVLCKYGAQ